MTIEKMKAQAGWWQVTSSFSTDYFVATSDNKLDAITRMFEKLKWAEIGNWQK